MLIERMSFKNLFFSRLTINKIEFCWSLEDIAIEVKGSESDAGIEGGG
jgi:hypothetical protein